MRQFDKRLSALEQASGGIETYIVLFGDACEEYDAALARGDAAAAFEVLRAENPHTSDEILTRVIRGARSYRDLDGAMSIGNTTLIKARYGQEGERYDGGA